MELLYFDNNATTRPAPEVLEAMWPCFTERYGNPSSLHAAGTAAADVVAAARASVARLIGAGSPGRVVFTSGGTESDQSAIEAALASAPGRRRVVTTSVEHSAVLEPLAALERRGYEIVRAPVDPSGALVLDELLPRIDSTTALVSAMLANNETGVIFDLAPIAEACKKAGALLHVDAVQACGKIPLNVEKLGADFVTVSAHKLHGPKGAGALYVRRGVTFTPLIRGGPQEEERRGGTENVPGVVGFGKAASLAREWLATDGPARLAALRDRLERGLVERIGDVVVHGASRPRVPNTTNVRFEGLSGEALVTLASDEGLCASTGAACSSSKHRPSHVLIAMGLEPAQASSSLRLSLSRWTTDAEVDRALEVLEGCVARLRKLAGRA
jgi:cysteine desulfurase